MALGTDVHRAYFGSTLFLLTIWFLYPIAWGVSDGGNVISPLGEMIFYGSTSTLAYPRARAQA
jgi:bacteriorhodopsin